MDKEILDFKVDTLLAFADSFGVDVPLIIQTTSGTLNGTVVNGTEFQKVYDEEDKFIGNPDEKNVDASIVQHYLKKNSSEKDYPAAGIWLKDAKLFFTGSAKPVEANFYYLFIDQIVGISIGELKIQNRDFN